MNGMKFVGTVKEETKKYPMTYLDAVELENRGHWFGLVRGANHSCTILCPLSLLLCFLPFPKGMVENAVKISLVTQNGILYFRF